MYSLDYWSLNKQDNSLINHSVKSIVSNIENGNSYYQIFKKQNYQTITDPVSAIADSIKNNFSDLLVIGMGGANLNPQMLVNFLGRQQNIKIHFLNNTDPMFFDDIMSIIDLKNTAMLAISNSGNTLETNSLVGCVIQEYKKHNFSDIGKRCFFITNTQNGTLKDIANEIEGQLIEHQENISGRYSTLSVVTLLIGLIANIDMQQYILGANRVIDDFCHNMEDSKPAISANLIFHCSKNILVNIGYLQKFNTFLEWYSQIISESLGKGGNGYTPVRGLGPNDQHSMLQLYLDGPQDKLFSLFYVNELDEKFLNYKTYNSDNLKYLANK